MKTTNELLAEPRTFTEDELSKIEFDLNMEMVGNAVAMNGIDHMNLHYMVMLARGANQLNFAAAAAYPAHYTEWELNDIQRQGNPSLTRFGAPVPPGKIKVAMSGVEGNPGWPALVPTDDPVCTAITKPPEVKPVAGVISMAGTPNPFDETEYPCLRDDTVPVGTIITGPGGIKLMRKNRERLMSAKGYDYYKVLACVVLAVLLAATLSVPAIAADGPAKPPERVQLTQQQQLAVHNLSVIQQYAAEQETKAQIALDNAKKAAEDARSAITKALDQIKAQQCQECSWATDGKLELVRPEKKPEARK
jgi:hypothetical protein